jgi:hypothetical protein
MDHVVLVGEHEGSGVTAFAMSYQDSEEVTWMQWHQARLGRIDTQRDAATKAVFTKQLERGSSLSQKPIRINACYRLPLLRILPI